MKPTTPLEHVDKALALAIDRQKRMPGFPVYTTVIDQLKYIRVVFDGTEKDKSKLHRLTIGAIAAKEFESTDETSRSCIVSCLLHCRTISQRPEDSPTWRKIIAEGTLAEP